MPDEWYSTFTSFDDEGQCFPLSSLALFRWSALCCSTSPSTRFSEVVLQIRWNLKIIQDSNGLWIVICYGRIGGAITQATRSDPSII